MLVESIAAVVLNQGLGLLSKLIERRRDVFYYVSKPDPRWQNRRLDLRIRKARGPRVEPPRQARVRSIA